MEEYGLGKRKRAEVTYKEQLSENQWLKIIEAGGDPQQEIKKRRKTGAGPNQDKLSGNEEADSDRLISEEEEEEEDDEEMSNDDFVVGTGRSRRKK